MKLLKKVTLLGFILFFFENSFSQDTSTNSTGNDFMTSNGKIYVVMAVVVIIVIGLFIYLASLDRKITKLEKGNNT